jgi:hypothetical protein
MKKIINNKVYDTATAKELASWSNSNDWRDFHTYSETLYRKKTGEFFLHGEGGPLTQYAVSTGQNSWSGGEKLIPLTHENARKWAEDHLDGDEYESIFGTITEDDSKQYATFSLSSSTLEMLRRKASESGKGLSEYLDSVLGGVFNA